METLLVLDRLVETLNLLLNALGASQKVSDIIAARVAENRDWTQEEIQSITDELAKNKAYAQQELSKP